MNRSDIIMSGDIHYQFVCQEHGKIISQCRCPSPIKTTRLIPCPGEVCKTTTNKDLESDAP